MTTLSGCDYFEALLSATLHLKCFTRLVSTTVANQFLVYHFVVDKMAVGLLVSDVVPLLQRRSATRADVVGLSCGLKPVDSGKKNLCTQIYRVFLKQTTKLQEWFGTSKQSKKSPVLNRVAFLLFAICYTVLYF